MIRNYFITGLFIFFAFQKTVYGMQGEGTITNINWEGSWYNWIMRTGECYAQTIIDFGQDQVKNPYAFKAHIVGSPFNLFRQNVFKVDLKGDGQYFALPWPPPSSSHRCLLISWNYKWYILGTMAAGLALYKFIRSDYFWLTHKAFKRFIDNMSNQTKNKFQDVFNSAAFQVTQISIAHNAQVQDAQQRIDNTGTTISILGGSALQGLEDMGIASSAFASTVRISLDKTEDEWKDGIKKINNQLSYRTQHLCTKLLDQSNTIDKLKKEFSERENILDEKVEEIKASGDNLNQVIEQGIKEQQKELHQITEAIDNLSTEADKFKKSAEDIVKSSNQAYEKSEKAENLSEEVKEEMNKTYQRSNEVTEKTEEQNRKINDLRARTSKLIGPGLSSSVFQTPNQDNNNKNQY